MKSRISVSFVLIIILSIVLSACGTAATPTQAPTQAPAATEAVTQPSAPSGTPIVIGASLPLSGRFSEPGTAAQEGYQVWAKMINDSGGLLGRPVELKIVDNASDQDTDIHFRKPKARLEI